jgi:two-component system nitrogen regulation response regulator GlnG
MAPEHEMADVSDDESEPAVLIVEDDPGLAMALLALLETDGYRVRSVHTARRAEAVLRAGFRGVVLLDIHLPDGNGLDLFHRIKAIQPRNRIVVMTAHDDLANVIGATRAGAFDFITKGQDLNDRVRVTVRNAFHALDAEAAVAQAATAQSTASVAPRLLTRAPQMDEVKAAIDKLASSRVSVLVSGPSGTGKEVVARCIHEAGSRAAGPFVAVNCAGIPDTLLESELFGYERGAFTGAERRKLGKFEVAAGGTLFLDEIGEMSLPLQAKVLRVLQDGRFERLGGNTVVQSGARIVAATNRDLPAMVQAGQFREDLYYRLAVFTLGLPPLSERRGDIALLVDHFVQQAARDEGKSVRAVAPEVLRLLELHPWPGNVRQLQNVIARAVVVCATDRVSLRDLPEAFVHELPEVALSGRVPGPESMAERLHRALSDAFPGNVPTIGELESAGIRLAMERSGGNLLASARALGIARATLYRRLGA